MNLAFSLKISQRILSPLHGNYKQDVLDCKLNFWEHISEFCKRAFLQLTQLVFHKNIRLKKNMKQ